MSSTLRNKLDGAIEAWRALSKKQQDLCCHALLSEACIRDLDAGDAALALLRAAAEPEAKDEIRCVNCGAIGPPPKPGDPFIHENWCGFAVRP